MSSSTSALASSVYSAAGSGSHGSFVAPVLKAEIPDAYSTPSAASGAGAEAASCAGAEAASGAGAASTLPLSEKKNGTFLLPYSSTIKSFSSIWLKYSTRAGLSPNVSTNCMYR